MAVHHCAIKGMAYPGDLQAIERIYDDLCKEQGFCEGSRAAQDLAKATMRLFSQGTVSEHEIRQSMERYLGQKSPAARLLLGTADARTN